MDEDEKWMNFALKEANYAMKCGEVPVGAVIVHNKKIISKGHNCPISQNDATAHAEIVAIRLAGEKIQNYRLIDTSLFVTLEPCTMCLGAIMNARINRVVFGAYDKKNGVLGSSVNLTSEIFFNHKIIVKRGVLEKRCENLLKDFFYLRR